MAIGAGKAILRVYQREFRVHTKADDSPITEADRLSHEIIVDALTAFLMANNRPIPVLSEEGSSVPYEERMLWKTYWLVDPLDGTKEFVNRNGEFTVNIALIRKRLPVAGVVLVPVHGTLYFAAKSLGAYRMQDAMHIDAVNTPTAVRTPTDKTTAPETHDRCAQTPKGAPRAMAISDYVAVSQRLPLPPQHDKDTDTTDHSSRVTVIGSRSHRSEHFERYVAEMERTGVTVEVVSRGSSLKFCMVAEGNADVYPRFGPTMEWDTAAGQAICTYAGKRVEDYQTGETMCYNKEDLTNNWFIVR